MDDSWKNDPRLKTMDKEKLELLTRFAEQAGRSKKEELPQTLMAIHLESQKQGIHFNDKETALLINPQRPYDAQGKKEGRSLKNDLSKTHGWKIAPNHTDILSAEADSSSVTADNNNLRIRCYVLYQLLHPFLRQTNAA